MIGLDTMVIVHGLVSSQPEHEETRGWLEASTQPLVTTDTNVGEVLRLLTHPRVFARPLSLAGAVDLFDGFRVSFDLEVVHDADLWWQELGAGSPSADLRGNEVFDARIAHCLRYHGVTRICTRDTDFRKFPFLEIVAPRL